MELENIFGQSLNKQQLKEMSPISLAFIGDGVHTLYVRNYVIKTRLEKIGDYHSLSAHYCNAKKQSEVLERISDILDEDEKDIVRRARNAKTHNKAKNADIMTYKKATSFEAVIGYLYLIGKFERMNEFLKLSIEGE